MPSIASATGADAIWASPGRRARLGVALAVALFCTASPATAAGDGERGRAKAEPCLACHGASGISGTPLMPSLAGQPELFLFLQLFLFREGLRAVEAMTPSVKGRSDQDLEDLAAYFSGLAPAAASGARDFARYAKGEQLAQRLHCASCHGRGYAGQAQMPRLTGQREDYMMHAMRQYQANARVGSDTIMTAVLYGLSPDDLGALAHFMAQQ